MRKETNTDSFNREERKEVVDPATESFRRTRISTSHLTGVRIRLKRRK